MKNVKLLSLLTAIMVGLLVASPAWATKHGDDHFKNGDNFDAYSMGNGKIHFKVLIYAEGSHCRYRAGRGMLESDPSYEEKDTGSRIFTHVEGEEDLYPNFIHYWADDVYNRPGIVDGWPSNKGRVWFKLHEGVIDVTNAYDGLTHTYNASEDIFDIAVKRPDGGEHLTYFEFDWYPPVRLDNKEFIMEVYSDHHKKSEKNYETAKHKLGTFVGAEPDEAPMLSEPFFYAVSENGVAGFGKAATVYTSIYDVEKYYTSKDPTEKKCEQNSDIIFVDTQDTMQIGFRACLQVHRSTDDQLMWRWTNKVNIPAYHKIHDFDIQGVKSRDGVSGKWFIDYRFKQLSWIIQHPYSVDLMESDMFEIQRAYHSDFSDAETIEVIPMEIDTLRIDTTGTVDFQTYSYVDSVPAAWWNPVENSYRIYYRVRRASSAQWGWTGHDYAASKAYTPAHEYAPVPFSETLSELRYSLADDFETSHVVNILLRLPNANKNEVRTEAKPGYSSYYLDPKQRFILRKIMLELSDTLETEIPRQNIEAALNANKYNESDEIYKTGVIDVPYTDVVNTPCVHHRYEVYIDTTDVTVYRPDKDYSTPKAVSPSKEEYKDVYFVEAANINTFAGSHQEFSDYVLLTWESTDGEVGTYKLETRPNSDSAWTVLADDLKTGWYKDVQADPEVAPEWQYRLTMTYDCNGNVKTSVAETTGGRNPYGKISGRVVYADGTGCSNILVSVSHVSGGGETMQRVRTDETGYYLLDSVPYGGDARYTVQPEHQTAEFLNPSGVKGPANITLSLDRSIASNVNFTNISSVRMSGRVLYENTTIPVRNAHFLLNGVMVMRNGSPYNTDASGNFEFLVPLESPFTIQAVKDGHVFKGDGFVREYGKDTLSLSKPLDGVHIYDQTKVRLIGRLAGGNQQGQLPLGHGLSTNYLGDDLKMVFELEGDNISHIVSIPSDESVKEIKDTIETTAILFETKRITIQPDVKTGEYAVDLFPVRYKITQATARGYSTLFAAGKTTETLDLTDAATKQGESIVDEDTIRYNATYSIIYHSPISISCTQLKYGKEQAFYGEETIKRQNILNEKIQVPIVEKQTDGTYKYLFGAPVYNMDNYDFSVTAHEDYYYNNDPSSAIHEEVRIKGGTLTVYNGLHDASNTEIQTHELDTLGQANITIPIDYVSFHKTGENALRVLDLSLEYEGDYVESQPIRAYVAGDKLKGKDYTASTHGKVVLLDVLRDPPGSHSSAYLEAGTSYTYNYSMDIKVTFGLSIGLKYGTGPNMFMGAFAGMGAGAWTGTQTDVSSSNSVSLPIVFNYVYKHNGSYTFTTSERITTSNDPYSVGAAADVYIGATQNTLYGVMDAVQPVDSLTYVTLAARSANGTMRTVAEGTDAAGQKYYLVIGSELGAKTYIKSTFVYTQDFIVNTLLEQLQQQRDALLMTGDSTTIASIVQSTGKPAYWSKVEPGNPNFGSEGFYVQLLPDDDKIYEDEVESYNRQFADWVALLIQNEREKINAIRGSNGQLLDTWSFGGTTSVSHSETYNYSDTYANKLYFPGLSLNSSLPSKDINLIAGKAPSVVDMMEKAITKLNDDGEDNKTEIAGRTAAASWKFVISPIVGMDWNMSPASHGTSHSKSTGFTLAGDDMGLEYMNVSVYRVVDKKNGFNDDSDGTRDFVEAGSDYLYGSYVYFLNGGATRCPWEAPDSSKFYTPKVPLSAGSLKLENPRLDINVHERSNVPADQPAIFNLKLTNEGEVPYGGSTYVPLKFILKLVDGTNPKGAKIFVDGAPLLEEGRTILVSRGQVMNKTVEVYAGEDYDYENISLALVSPCQVSNASKCTFSVHYMPVACPVNISAPHDKWIMNTLSPQDSAGWYLPIVIDGFDVNYKGFDHIEFQYKLTPESDEAWVNLCSYYTDEELYKLASGNKAMMTSGRIDNIRFYGERDPMEQQYDLRAVAFCRHGNAYITRSSAVLTGIKDTRPPRVFGTPEPANAILGVGDNLLLRFNEPIAGNYLDADNNFQLLGITNETDISAGTSLHFDGTDFAFAESKVTRGLVNKSFTVDVLVKPTDYTKANVFFNHGEEGLEFGMTDNNCLYLTVGEKTIISKPMAEPLMSFTRLLVRYDATTSKVRFFAGSMEVTPDEAPTLSAYNIRAPFIFGSRYNGNMLEARVWTKALTPAEIANTAGYLTGYERELLAYYPMNEGKGGTLTDKANGATLYMGGGASWTHSLGISLAIGKDETVELAGDLLARNLAQDATYMFWFKTPRAEGNIFTAPSEKLSLAFYDGELLLKSGMNAWSLGDTYGDGAWHHFVLAISRTYNNVTVYTDGNLVQAFSATKFGGVSGRMFLGGQNFEGNIDEFVVFEQALPKTLLENYENRSPYGDEMGLLGYLPFEEMKENDNGILELVFSPCDHRQILVNGMVVEKRDTLILGNLDVLKPDRDVSAPVSTQGQLTKLNFDWAFNEEELMINLKMLDKEINKQTIYITVRDVEDLNGNPMESPVMWTCFVDKNALKWAKRQMTVAGQYENFDPITRTLRVLNTSGHRHQYTVSSIPDWLTLDATSGSLEPTEEVTLTFSFNVELTPGEYGDILYLTDENGLSEPLEVHYTVTAEPPYEEVDKGKYPLNMSICGQVFIDGLYDSDERDLVYAMFRNECVGMANIDVDNMSNTSKLFLTVYGNDSMNGRPITFQLWQAATGKLVALAPSMDITFGHGNVYGCGNDNPVTFNTAGSETQNIDLTPGWNWISFNVDVNAGEAPISSIMTASNPWVEGDIIKNPASKQFVTYSEGQDAFVGMFTTFDYHHIYMVYAKDGNVMRVSGNPLEDSQLSITVKGNSWSPLPCLLQQATTVTEALAGYYDHASPGDLVKSHEQFAVFSSNNRWEGDLTTIRPGEGYLIKRLGASDVTVPFYNTVVNAPKKVPAGAQPAFRRPSATNMTMIAKVEDGQREMTNGKLKVYVGDELAAEAMPITIANDNDEALYFLTIQSDKVGELRFELDGQNLVPETGTIHYSANGHAGLLKAPIMLKPADERPYKIIENNHIIIIRNNEKYSITGKKL